jgi:perosamine synthetase
MQSELYAPGAPVAAGEIPLCVPFLGGREGEYVEECIRTNFVSSVGPFVNRFERMIAEYVGAEHGIASVTGTAALHISLLVAGVQPNDEVVVPALTFIAPANAVRYCGAWPVFIDANPATWQMSTAALEQFLCEECEVREGKLLNRGTGRRVAALLPVHALGHPVDMDPLLDLAKQFGLPVIEDATESLGSTYKGRPVGTLGDIGCFSFNGNKLITTGGGGMIVTSRTSWAKRARYLSTQAKDDPVEYVHGAIGYNYRLTNVSAAIGCAQAERLDDHIASKQRTASFYRKAFAGRKGISFMPQADWASPVFWLSTILIDPVAAGFGSRDLLAHLRTRGIQSRPLWEPLNRSKVFRDAQRRACPEAERLAARALSLPSSVGISEAELQHVVDEVAGCPSV